MKSAYRVRWHHRKEMGQLVDLASRCELGKLSEEMLDREKMVRGTRCCLICLIDEQVVGMLLYRFGIRSVQFLAIGVDPDHRRRGVATRLMRALEEVLATCDFEKITVQVPETELATQLLLRKHGYRATGIKNNGVKGTGEDAYTMEFLLRGKVGAVIV